MPWWEFSVGYEWIESHILSEDHRFEPKLNKARRYMQNILAFYEYLQSVGVVKDLGEVQKAFNYMCSGKKLNLVKHIPYTGKETWCSTIPPELGREIVFYVVDFWLMVLYFECGESWDKLLQEAEKSGNAVDKAGLIANFRHKLALAGYDHPKRIMHGDVSYDDLADARRWFYGGA